MRDLQSLTDLTRSRINPQNYLGDQAVASKAGGKKKSLEFISPLTFPNQGLDSSLIRVHGCVLQRSTCQHAGGEAAGRRGRDEHGEDAAEEARIRTSACPLHKLQF